MATLQSLIGATITQATFRNRPVKGDLFVLKTEDGTTLRIETNDPVHTTLAVFTNGNVQEPVVKRRMSKRGKGTRRTKC